jgi:multidrug efflux pump subunit AcrB
MYFRLMPLAGNPLQLDMDMLRDYAEDYVRPRMERVQGVSAVGVSGGAERQIQILIDPAKLARRGISLTFLPALLVTLLNRVQGKTHT